MPRKGPAYPITKDWRKAVRAGIDALGISDAAFARSAKISKASLSEALNDESVQSTIVPDIHKALGWPPPRGVMLSPDNEELVRIADRLDPIGRAKLLERALTLEEERKRK